ncbi:MAG: LysR family transcriptional regulator [Pseudomonadota bacterium]
MRADWDDLRVVLGVWRGGSTRAASDLVGMSHATIARRIDALETRLSVKIFDRLPSGYALTQDGEELVKAAQRVENELNAAQLKLTGRDKRLAGLIRITTIDVVATSFLMPILSEFSQQYPEIEFEVGIGYRALDLRKREADIALRGINKPPEHLIGHRLTGVAWAGYATPQYIEQHDFGPGGNARWIGFGTRSANPPWLQNSPNPDLPAWGVFDDVPLQIEAARHHLGIGYLPCFVSDRDRDLARVPPHTVVKRHDFWLLRHRDTRSTVRMRVFSEFLTEAFRQSQSLFEGRLDG